MSKIDVAKEEIAYLKLWIGIMVVTDISLIGWLLGNFKTADWLLVVGNLVAIGSTSVGVCFLHRRIENRIKQLEGL